MVTDVPPTKRPYECAVDRWELGEDVLGTFFVAGEKTAGRVRSVLVMVRIDSNADGSLRERGRPRSVHVGHGCEREWIDERTEREQGA